MPREQHLIVAAGVCAALHVAKLPPAVAALQQALAITLVQAGFLLSIVQVAGMLLGAVMGAWADGLGPRRIMAVVQCSEVDEVLSAFPEFAEDFTRTSAAFDGLVAELEDAYARLRGIANQKEFALEATKTRFPRALFQVRAGRSASVRAVLRDTPPEALLRALGLRDEGPAA